MIVESAYVCFFHDDLKHIIAEQRTIRYNCRDGAVAHRLEQAAHNHLVDGSIPSSPTIEKSRPSDLLFSMVRHSLTVDQLGAQRARHEAAAGLIAFL